MYCLLHAFLLLKFLRFIFRTTTDYRKFAENLMLPYEGGKAGEFFAYNMNSENDFWSTFFGAKQCFYGCYTWYTIYDEFILNDHFYRKNWVFMVIQPGTVVTSTLIVNCSRMWQKYKEYLVASASYNANMEKGSNTKLKLLHLGCERGVWYVKLSRFPWHP